MGIPGAFYSIKVALKSGMFFGVTCVPALTCISVNIESRSASI